MFRFSHFSFISLLKIFPLEIYTHP